MYPSLCWAASENLPPLQNQELQQFGAPICQDILPALKQVACEDARYKFILRLSMISFCLGLFGLDFVWPLPYLTALCK